MSCGCLVGVWRVFEGCLEGVWKVSKGCVEVAWKVSWAGLEAVSSQDWSSQDRSGQVRTGQARTITTATTTHLTFTKREGPMCLVGVWKVSNRCLGCIRIVTLKENKLSWVVLRSVVWVELNWVELRLCVVIIPLNFNWIELKIEPTSTLSREGVLSWGFRQKRLRYIFWRYLRHFRSD